MFVASSSTHTRTAGRFSLLLLDEGEYYVRDFVASCSWPADVKGNWQRAVQLPGTVRLCTRSVFFDPDDVRVPIVRLPFSDLETLEGVGKKEVTIAARRWTTMKANAVDAPYEFEKERMVTWQFQLSYAPLSDFMPLAQQMLLASRMSVHDAEEHLSAFVAGMEEDLRFNLGHLRRPSIEHVAFEGPVREVSPLALQPGRIAVTAERLYFQPLQDVGGHGPVRSHPLPGVAAVARRRCALKDVGLEVFFVAVSPDAGIPGPLWDGSSALFAFRSTEQREAAVTAIMKQGKLGQALPGELRGAAAACGSALEAGGTWLPRVLSAWQRGHLSNFDYLMYCNLAAGRSFNDLSQYPVFPWVIKDYVSNTLDLFDPGTFRDLSKPVGALNPARLAQYRMRHREMAQDAGMHPASEPPFMYGTHYSCPGYVLFWLVRAAPAHMLRLQNGRFDAPDRLFCSISETWESVLTNPADVKELIPEFYMPVEGSAFLVNSKRLALGTRQDGRPVGDVELPPWALGSPKLFLQLQRAALEAPFVSANLHHWINLIFGVKQRGLAAVKADNVFRHLTYEGAIDPDSIIDPLQRAAAETAINEFGQCPRQIFSHAHPQRLVCPSPPEVAMHETEMSPRSYMQHSGEASLTSQSLSLTLASAILAAATQSRDTTEVDQSLEETEELRRLDVLQCHATQGDRGSDDLPGISAFHEGASEPLTSENNPENPSEAQRTSSPFMRAKSGMMGRLGAIKEAFGEAVVATKEAAASSPLGRRQQRTHHHHHHHDDKLQSSQETDSTDDTGSNMATSPSSRLSNIAESLSNKWHSLSISAQQSDKDGSSMLPEIGKDDFHSKRGEGAEASDNVPPTTQVHSTSMASTSNEGHSSAGAASFKAVERLISKKTTPKAAESPHEAHHDERWGIGLRDRLHLDRTFTAGSEAVNAVALARIRGAPYLYAACHDASLRVFDLASGTAMRTCALGLQPLTSIALLPSISNHPTVCSGSYDGRVYAYDAEMGRVYGSFAAHDDVVSCVQYAAVGAEGHGEAPPLAAASGPRSSILATSSWDCSVAIWSLEEGRQPWDSSFPQPMAVAGDLPGGIWSLALSCGALRALVGTEDGDLALLDMRIPYGRPVWQRSISQDYVAGVSLLPNDGHALAACANGVLTLVDMRSAGQPLIASAQCNTSLRCCASDGIVGLAGGESGAVVVWDVGRQLGGISAAAGTQTQPELDGLFSPMMTSPVAPLNALACQRMGGKTCLVIGHERGLLRSYWTYE